MPPTPRAWSATSPAPAPVLQVCQSSKRAGQRRHTTAVARRNRLGRQRHQQLAEMRRELPTACGLGVNTSSNGYRQYWRGYKLHLDVADGQIPVSALLTGAQVNDSQVAIPLMAMTTARGVTWCYDVMDSAYDCDLILAHREQLGHVPVVQPHSRRRKRRATQLPAVLATQFAPELRWAQQERFRERTSVERVFARLKDEFGGRYVRVRGAKKVMAHLLMGVIALTVDQLVRWAATALPSTTPCP